MSPPRSHGSSRPRGPLGRARVPLVTLGVTLAVGLIPALGPAPAPAAARIVAAAIAAPVDDGTSADLTIGLTEVAPTIAGPGGQVHVRAQVTNDGTVRLPAQDVSLVRSSAGLVRRSDVTDWATGTEPAGGATIAHRRIPALAPGASADVDLVVTDVPSMSAATYGAVPVSIEADDVALHTFLGFQRRKEYVPLDVSWLVPVTLDPSAALFGEPGARRLDAWTRVTSPESRVSRILSATSGEGDVAWALDPTLISPPEEPPVEEPDQAADETETDAPEPPPTPLDQERVLRQALSTRIRDAAGDHGPVLLPDADADVASTYETRGRSTLLRTQVRRAQGLAREVSGRADIAWPVTPPVTSAQLSRLKSAYPGRKPAAVVVPASVLPASIFTPDAASKASDGRRLLAFDDRLSATVARATTPQNGALAAQELVADSVALLDQRPGTPRHLLIAPGRGFSPDTDGFSTVLDTAAAVPWLRASSLDDLLTAARDAVPVRTADPADTTSDGNDPAVDRLGSEPPLLTQGATRSIRADLSEVRAMADIRDDGIVFGSMWSETGRQLTSVRWRSAPGEWTETRSQLDDVASSGSDGLRVSAGAVNFFAESGRLQVTIANRLDVGVHDLRVELTPENPRLRLESQPEPIEIGAGSRGTVATEATALAAGDVPVTIRMLTSEGSEIGQPATLDVHVSPTGDWIYWAVGALAAILLAVGLWRTLRGERRRPAGSGTPEDSTRDD
jgi:hypothetical protein